MCSKCWEYWFPGWRGEGGSCHNWVLPRKPRRQTQPSAKPGRQGYGSPGLLQGRAETLLRREGVPEGQNSEPRRETPWHPLATMATDPVLIVWRHHAPFHPLPQARLCRSLCACSSPSDQTLLTFSGNSKRWSQSWPRCFLSFFKRPSNLLTLKS